MALIPRGVLTWGEMKSFLEDEFLTVGEGERADRYWSALEAHGLIGMNRLDEWGTEIRYGAAADRTYVCVSAGPDRMLGTGDDVRRRFECHLGFGPGIAHAVTVDEP